MSESDLSANFVKLTKSLDPWRIENMLTAGTPDVNLSTGWWVELKWSRSWPVRASSHLRLDHYTDIQKSRLIQRWNAGGGAALLLQVRTEWFVFNADIAQKVGTLTRQQLIDCATYYFPCKPTSEKLCACFRVRQIV